MKAKQCRSLLLPVAFVFVALAGLFVAILNASEKAQEVGAWQTDFATAREIAIAEGKPLMLFFTGSDWCPPCRKLKADILDTAEFRVFASENLVLQFVDFPQFTQLAPALAAQNHELAAAYGVITNDMLRVPAVILIAPDGELLGRTGYRPGGATAYIAHLIELANGQLALASAE